jgi:AcrR family transcriptional regulator
VTTGGQADRRTQLTRAAFEVFTDRGYRNSSVADIVTAAGLGHGSFYNYFANRREILDAVIDLGLRERAPELSPPEEFADTLDEFLDAMTAPWRALHSLSEADNKVVSLMVFDAGAIDRQLTERVIEIFESIARSVQRQIDHGIEAGYLRPGLDSKVLGEMLVCASVAMLLPGQGGSPLPGGIDHVIDQAKELLRAGLGKPANAAPTSPTV